MKFPELGNPMIAHRGSSIDAPENTLPAYKLAKEQGFTFIEVDVVQLTDGVPVMVHDPEVDRTMNATGFVSSFHLTKSVNWTHQKIT